MSCSDHRGALGHNAPVSAYKKVKEGIEAVKVRLGLSGCMFEGSVWSGSGFGG